MPDPNPGVQCQASADCQSAYTCLNGTCHGGCDVSTDCANPQDRCLDNLCVPDRRPVVQCVLNSECGPDQSCIDSRCVSLTYD
jgi:hypothetical protein